ncbi:MAG: hypothetical protein IKL68_04530 [Clostridia bacterium]|nr:hypothetical protein [Clostridia bacterium]
MNRLTFKVNGPKDGNISPLLKAVTKIRCRIYLDVENGFVTVENVHDELIDSVIDLINEYYVLLGVEVDNLVEDEEVFEEKTCEEEAVQEPSEERVVVSVTEFSEECPEGRDVPAEEYQSEVADDTVIVSVEEFPPAPKEVGPQSEDDLIIKKIEFQNPAIEAAMNKLLRTAYWAMYKQCSSEKEIVNHIWTAIREMSLKFTDPNIIEFSIGDVVDCYFGTHLPREINGSHVLGIVLDITADKMVYVVPITKALEDIDAKVYITFHRDIDVDYYYEQYYGGTALLDKGRYLRAERLQSVVGKAKPNFLYNLVTLLPKARDYSANFEHLFEDIDDSEPEMIFTDDSEEDTTTSVDEVAGASSESTPKAASSEVVSSTLPKGQTAEDVLLTVVGDALKDIEVGGSILANTRNFLTAIGLPTDNPIINEAFLASTSIKRITYENIIAEVMKTNSELTEDTVKDGLKEVFRSWVASNATLAPYNRLAITSLLKLFAKAVNG